MKLIRGICPLLSVATIISKDRSELHSCSNNCALFVDSEEQCSLRLLAVAADLIRYRVEE